MPCDNPLEDLWNLLTGRSSWADFTQEELGTLIPQAIAHGVAPLLYHAWQATKTPGDYPAFSSLEKVYYQSVARSLALRHELERLETAFSRSRLAYLPLKGAALAWTVYPDPALRPMNDLDLLAQPSDLLKAVRAAQAIGYRLDKLTNHAVLHGGPAQSISLELHWCLPGGQPLPADLFFDSNNLRSKLFESFTYRYCCEHLLRQHPDNPRLIWLYDLRLLRRRLEPDSNQTYAEMTSFLEYSPSANILETTKASLEILPKRTRARLLGALLFPSAAYMKWRYRPQPDWLWPAYYPKRLLDWMKFHS